MPMLLLIVTAADANAAADLIPLLSMPMLLLIVTAVLPMPMLLRC
jgi:hypothetical protein